MTPTAQNRRPCRRRAGVMGLMHYIAVNLDMVMRERLAAVTGDTGSQRQREPELRSRLTIPVYTGYDDGKYVADFLEKLNVHVRAAAPRSSTCSSGPSAQPKT